MFLFPVPDSLLTASETQDEQSTAPGVLLREGGIAKRSASASSPRMSL